MMLLVPVITSLSIEGGARVMGYHAVTAAKGVLSRAQDVVLGCGLDVPIITSITCCHVSSRCRY
jgi:hypothetical protein